MWWEANSLNPEVRCGTLKEGVRGRRKRNTVSVRLEVASQMYILGNRAFRLSGTSGGWFFFFQLNESSHFPRVLRWNEKQVKVTLVSLGIGALLSTLTCGWAIGLWKLGGKTSYVCRSWDTFLIISVLFCAWFPSRKQVASFQQCCWLHWKRKRQQSRGSAP